MARNPVTSLIRIENAPNYINGKDLSDMEWRVKTIANE
jgi:hypothetical protein